MCLFFIESKVIPKPSNKTLNGQQYLSKNFLGRKPTALWNLLLTMFFRANDLGKMPQFNVQLLTRVLNSIRYLLPISWLWGLALQVCPTLQNGSPDPYFIVDPMQGIIAFGNNQVFKCDNVLPMHCPQNLLFDRYLQPTIDASFEGIKMSQSYNFLIHACLLSIFNRL